MTKLNFPNAEDFFKYLMEKGIHRYGIVAHCKVETGEKGLGIYTEKFVLSSIDDKTSEILECSVPYYRSMFVTEQHNRKEAKEPKEKTLEALNKKIKEWTGNYKLTLLHCQFEA